MQVRSSVAGLTDLRDDSGLPQIAPAWDLGCGGAEHVVEAVALEAFGAGAVAVEAVAIEAVAVARRAPGGLIRVSSANMDS